MWLVVQGRRFCSAQRRVVQHFPVLSSEQRLKVDKEVRERVDEERECYRDQIETFASSLSMENPARAADLVTLMKACKSDIVDCFPEEQKTITVNAYNVAKKVRIVDKVTTDFHNTALEAFLFQNVNIVPDKFLREMRESNSQPNRRTYENLIGLFCKNQDIDAALGVMFSKESPLSLNETVAAHLIYCHCARGEYFEAEKIAGKLTVSAKNKLHNSFLLGAACNGDIDRLRDYIQADAISDKDLLDALVLLGSKEEDSVILDKLPLENSSSLAQVCRRPVKQLIENGFIHQAEAVIMKTEEIKSNSSTKVKAMMISPSVIILNKIIHHQNDPNIILEKIQNLQAVDSRILERSVILLVDFSLTNPSKKSECQNIMNDIISNGNEKIKDDIENLLSQYVTEKVKNAANEDEVITIVKQTFHLGLKLQHMREWSTIMSKLIPPNLHHSQEDLTQRANEVFEKLKEMSEEADTDEIDESDNDCPYGYWKAATEAMYTQGIIWVYILRHIISLNSSVGLRAVANIFEAKGISNAEEVRFLSVPLGDCLYSTRDVFTVMDILQNMYKNCEKSGNFENYSLLTTSIIKVLKIAKTKEDKEIDALIEDLLQELWSRNLPLQQGVKDSLLKNIQNPCLSLAAKNIAVLPINDDIHPRQKVYMKPRDISRQNQRNSHSHDDRYRRRGYDDRNRRGYDERQRLRRGNDDRNRGAYDDRNRGAYDDRNRTGYDDRNRRGYADRNRGEYDDRNRTGYDDRNRGGNDDRNRRGYDYHNRKGYDDRNRGGYDDSSRGYDKEGQGQN